MSKKLFCLALALMMLVCSTAFAATPSKTTTTVTSKAPSSSVVEELAPAFVLKEKPEGETGDAAEYAVMEIDDFLASNNGAPVVGAFGEDNVAAIEELLPEGVDTASLFVAEVIEIYMSNYDPMYGEVTVPFHTETADGTVVAVLGVYDGAYTWYPLATEYDAVNGDVVVTFTKEVLEVMSALPTGAEMVLVFLNAEA